MHRNVQYAKDRLAAPAARSVREMKRSRNRGRYRKANIQTGMYVNFCRGATGCCRRTMNAKIQQARGVRWCGFRLFTQV
ncbi:hypothetical protein SAMCCGM7_Ch0174 [Sinorhizobium americanum CCGM7]|nr:hypothetical protein SAMCCGM7_Ch0174 [Sinorhizobium americanum CCGM7]